MSILGDRIKKERLKLNLTREDLAKKIGVSYSAIAMYEQGNREPDIEILKQISNYFKCSIDYLIGKSDFKTYDDELEFSKEYLSKLFGIPKEVIHNSLRYPKYLTEKELQILQEIEKSKYNEDFNISIYLKSLDESQKEHILSAFNSMENANKIISKAINEKNLNAINNNVFPMPDEAIPIPVVGKISAGLPILAEENREGYEFAPSSLIKKGYTYFYLRVQGDSMNLKFNDGDIVLVQQQDYLENDEIGVILVNGFDATVKKYKNENGLIILYPMSTNPEHSVQVYNPKEMEIKIIGKVVSYQGKI